MAMQGGERALATTNAQKDGDVRIENVFFQNRQVSEQN